MSIHPSLSAPDKSSKTRTVLKRSERLKIMMEKNQWKEGDDVYRLPKIKTIRITIKKEKAVAEKTETAAAGAVGPETAAAPAASSKAPAGKAPAAKAPAAKAPAAKAQDKK